MMNKTCNIHKLLFTTELIISNKPNNTKGSHLLLSREKLIANFTLSDKIIPAPLCCIKGSNNLPVL